MISGAITAAIGAVLLYFGVQPGPYLGVVWLVIKVLLVGGGLLLASRALKKQKLAPATLDVSAADDKIDRR